jgi:hypothetical protein
MLHVRTDQGEVLTDVDLRVPLPINWEARELCPKGGIFEALTEFEVDEVSPFLEYRRPISPQEGRRRRQLVGRTEVMKLYQREDGGDRENGERARAEDRVPKFQHVYCLREGRKQIIGSLLHIRRHSVEALTPVESGRAKLLK